jgi:hypothetical protein
MKINLSIPPLSTDPVEFVQVNPATLASDLAALPRDDFLYSGHRILNDLKQINQASVDDELRLKLLDLYRVSILNLAKGLRKSLGESSLPINKKLLTKQDLTVELHQHLANGYKRILMNQHLTDGSDLSENILIVSSERAMFSLLEIITLSYLSYAYVPESTWKEMHTIYQLAHDKGYSGIKIHDVADSSKSLKIDDIYLFALLLALSEPYGLPNGSLYTLTPYFHLWISYLSLFDKNNLDELRYTYRIDPDLDKPFLPFPEARPEGKLYVTTDSLVHQMLGPNPPISVSTAKDTNVDINLFSRSFFPKLIASWSNYPIRRFQRNSASGEIQLISGYSSVIKILKAGSTKLNEKTIKQFQQWQIVNDSATGLGVEYNGHEVKSVKVGALVLYRTNEMKRENQWSTGIVRRFIQAGRSRLSLGIQRLPPGALTGKLSKLAGDNEDRQPILMYPENTLLNSEATLVTPPGTFSPAAQYLISLDNGMEYKVMAIKTVQINPVLEQFTFEHMND